MKTDLKIYLLTNDVITESPTQEEEECGCDFGCPTDFAQLGQ